MSAHKPHASTYNHIEGQSSTLLVLLWHLKPWPWNCDVRYKKLGRWIKNNKWLHNVVCLGYYMSKMLFSYLSCVWDGATLPGANVLCVCVCVCVRACARMCVSRYTLCAFDSLLLQHIVRGLQVEACNCRVSRPLTRCQPDYTSWHVLCNNPFTLSLACSTFALTVKNYLTEKGKVFCI